MKSIEINCLSGRSLKTRREVAEVESRPRTENKRRPGCVKERGKFQRATHLKKTCTKNATNMQQGQPPNERNYDM